MVIFKKRSQSIQRLIGDKLVLSPNLTIITLLNCHIICLYYMLARSHVQAVTLLYVPRIVKYN